MTDIGKFTDRQRQFIGECRIDETGVLDWCHMLAENGGTWTARQIGGVVSSLAAIGFIYVDDYDPNGNPWWVCSDDDCELFPNNCYEY